MTIENFMMTRNRTVVDFGEDVLGESQHFHVPSYEKLKEHLAIHLPRLIRNPNMCNCVQINIPSMYVFALMQAFNIPLPEESEPLTSLND